MTLHSDVIALNEQLAAKRVLLKSMFEGIDDLADDKKADRASAIKAANDELSGLREQIDAKQDLLNIENVNNDAMKAMRQPVGERQVFPGADSTPTDYSDELASEGFKSVREMIEKSPGAAAVRAGEGLRGFRGDLGTLALKTLLTSSAQAPANIRLPDVVPYATEGRTTVGDLFLQGTTGGQVIEYYEETTFTNAAAETAEGNLKPEATLAFTLRSENVRKIATWIPVTDEMLSDVPAFESYLRQRLGFMVKQREEQELIDGNGVSPNIQGVLRRTGVQVVTGLGQSTIDSIFQAITEVRADAFSEPNAAVFHPRDWFDIRTSKDTTANYLLGPANSEGPEIVWGLRIVQTTAIPQNTGLVGDFRQGQVFRRSGIDIAISTENEDYFTKNKVAVRAEERLALAIYRPAAFCKVEGLVVGS